MTDFARILSSAALVLLCLGFFGCDRSGATDKAPATATSNSVKGEASTGGLNIVFVKVDSLQAGYTQVADELTRLEENFNKAEQNHNARVAAFQKEVQRVQNQVQQGLLAPNKIQAEQQRMAKKEQEIMQQREIALGSIQEDQLRIQQQFSERVKAVLEELQAENNYDFILNQGQNSAVLITNDRYDITNLVLERLNASQDSLQ
ncbi:Skp family chaperone for outer membrane proteins [Lewinella aquimaris]|uniref:Skp family chaperone for outer membrane proteins n=1 Tax=Neolewinella aquimaris TaxID=1835722 RepID=A0A840E9M2_9BACT|nr:OmpH family outer membrane protein [Neolewinella aquimaris]MBB4080037.1 Skp family chaperone for outer membrane proteins [Neolewinella aquimaris]